MADLLTETIEAAHEGLNTDTDPSIQKLTAPEVANLLVHRDGVLPMRGPLVNDGNPALAIGRREIIAGVWWFRNRLLIGRVNKSGTANIEPHRAPYALASSESVLADPEVDMKYIDFDTHEVKTMTTSADGVIGGRGVRIGSSVYGIGYARSTGNTVIVDGGYQWKRRILRWGGSFVVNPTIHTTNPEGGQDCIHHLNRLFVLGGIDIPGGGTTLEGNTLFFSDPGGPDSDVASKWQDDVSGLTNKIVVESDDPNDFGVGLAKLGQNLMIFKRRSIHVLYGFSPSTFTVRTVASGLGCLDRRSIVEVDGGVYFLSDQGYMRYDGEELVNVSGPLQSELRAAAHHTVGGAGVVGGFAQAFKTHDNYLMLSLGAQSFSGGGLVTTDRFCALLEQDTERWTRFSSNATYYPTLLSGGRTSEYQWLYDSHKFVKASYITTPETADENVRGFDDTRDLDDFSLDSITNGLWTVETGAGNWLVSGGRLDAQNTTAWRAYRTNLQVVDARAVIKFNLGTSSNNYNFAVTMKRLDGNNRLHAIIAGFFDVFKFSKIDGGSSSDLGSAGGFNGQDNTDYWLEFTIAGNNLTGKIYTTDPDGSSPTAAVSTITHTLTGGDATKFGSGVAGNPGLDLTSISDATATADNWLLDAGGFTRARIPAKWHSRLAALATPQYMAQLHRVMINNAFVLDGAADGGSGWFVTVLGGDGRVLVPEFQLPAMGDPSSYITRRMDVQDHFTEAADAQVRVEWKDSGGTYPAVVKAEIYEAILEYQVTRQRRAT